MLLRLTQHEIGDGRQRVEVAWEGDGARRTAEAVFSFAVTPQDEEDVRWYLEEFLEYPEDPAPKIARRVERRMAILGEELFQAVFQADETRDLWAELRRHLPETRIEIAAGAAAANTLPWELLRDPRTRELALAARSFVRTQPRVAVPPRVELGQGPVRILAVICRPSGAFDVPFRSVATRLIKGLDAGIRAVYDLDVLRPPTFEQLGRTLRQAQTEGLPYHAVHFDGHGGYRDYERRTGRSGKHGYVAFENPDLPGNQEPIDGRKLGGLLYETGVPVLVLNACRSAHAEPAAQPADASQEDFSSQVRAFGSLAQELMDCGVGGVVAMRYNVLVTTGVRIVGELYDALAHGRTLGEAVTQARKNLADQPLRESTRELLPLQDWPMPVVYEAAPLRLFPETGKEGLVIHIPQGTAVTASGLDAAVPPPPDAGFYGRDETLLALDRAFDRDRIVLLHAYAGSGKTTTAAEFARWYAKTGGVDGPVLWSPFEHHLPLPRLLDRLGQTFEGELENAGIHWLALPDDQRRAVALQFLSQIPVLWIWDNVEPVAGFPAGTPSAWSEDEQKDLADFLRALRDTKAKVLLTSRRDERAWLKGLPTRVQIPPMPLLERFQLARALAEKHSRRLTEVEDWSPLLKFTDGNPLTITVLVGQTLRAGFRTRAQIEAFVERLRAGEAAFEDEMEEGRARSLGASLAYGFENAFSEEERRRLALLSLFQGFVQEETLRVMGDPEMPWCLDDAQGMKRAEWIALLDRAAEVGLLISYGDGYYGIHPAVPWFFQRSFEKTFPERDLAATQAYVEAMGELGISFLNRYQSGSREAVVVLGAEEANLLNAYRLAQRNGWWKRVINTMQGLWVLYGHTGRRNERKLLVEKTVPNFVDPLSGGPIEGREGQWSLLTEFRVRVALDELRWAEAERLQLHILEWDRKKAARFLTVPNAKRDQEGKLAVQTLAISLNLLGHIHREQGRVDCVPLFEESLSLAESLGDQSLAAVNAYNLGHVYLVVPQLRSLEQAERWSERSLELHAAKDGLGRGRCFVQLGTVSLQRFLAAAPEERGLKFLDEAIRRYSQALKLLPSEAVDDLAVANNQLGIAFGNAGELDRALVHYREAIRLEEARGNFFNASKARFGMALVLMDAGRREDALEYATAALQGFERFGERAEGMIQQTKELIEEIQWA